MHTFWSTFQLNTSLKIGLSDALFVSPEQSAEIGLFQKPGFTFSFIYSICGGERPKR